MNKHFLLTIIISFMGVMSGFAEEDVKVTVFNNRSARIQNGILDIKIDNRGKVSYFAYKGKNLLGSNGTFYFSAMEDKAVELYPTKVEKKVANTDYVELVYTNDTARIWKQQGYILKKGDSKLYTYVLMKGTARKGKLEEARVAYRLSENFLDGYVTDKMQGLMPSVAQMNAFTDADKIQDATYRLPNGDIYTKYDWANYVADDHVHGVMNTDGNLGVWALQASAEYVNGGPQRQDLTVHMDTKSPVICQYFHGGHFGATKEVTEVGQDFTKLFGPFAIYVNEGTREDMIADAQAEAQKEIEAWPYQWFDNDNYPKTRMSVSGKIHLTNYPTASNLQIVLSEPGVDPYQQTKGYSFWTRTNTDGSFTLNHVRPGTYSLFAYATNGEITETLEKKDVSVGETDLNLGTIEWTPAKYEQLIWRIGESDRLTDGFCLSAEPRQYGLFDQSPADLTFRIGESEPSKDWYYAQTKNGSWNIVFTLNEKPTTQCYLTASVAGAAKEAQVTFKVNGRTITTKTLDSNDGSIYRSAIKSGRHSLHIIKIPAAVFKVGENTVTLQMSRASEGSGVMWDCLKLETGKALTTGIRTINATSDSALTPYSYSIAGIRKTTYIKGLSIRNGKKYIDK